MKQKEWTIRIINPIPYDPKRPIGHVGLPGLWVEQFRRLGYLTVLKEYDGNHSEFTVDGQTHRLDGYEVIEFRCATPKEVDTKAWADMNAQRMQSFGINAVAAPKWESGAFGVEPREEGPKT